MSSFYLRLSMEIASENQLTNTNDGEVPYSMTVESTTIQSGDRDTSQLELRFWEEPRSSGR